MKTKYFGAGESYDKSLQLLLMGREISGFNAQESVAAVAEHIFILRIPSHRVRVRLLQENVRKKFLNVFENCYQNDQQILQLWKYGQLPNHI